MAEKRLETVQTDGSNGYEAGTWEWRIRYTLSDGREAVSFDGGFETREHALQEGRRALRSIESEAVS